MGLLTNSAVGLVAGALGALLLMTVVPQAGSRDEEGARLAPMEALTDRVRELEDENRRLRARMDALADRPTEVSRLPADLPTRAEFDALEALVHGGHEAESQALAGAPQPVLQAAIEEALDQRAETARMERERAVERKREERIARQVGQWTEELGLTAYQGERLTGLMLDREVAAVEIKASVAAGSMTGDEARAEWGQVEGGFQTELSETLTPFQLETFQQLQARGKDGADR